MKILLIGAGPANLFAAYELSKNKDNDILVIESGSKIEDRKCSKSGLCNCGTCDILCGEGGAGGFSDGKNTYSLKRGTNTSKSIFKQDDEEFFNRIDDLMETHSFGGITKGFDEKAYEKYLGTKFTLEEYQLRHYGSDGIQDFVGNFSKVLKERGIKFLYNTDVLDVELDGKVTSQSNTYAHGFLIHQPDVIFIGTGLAGSKWLASQSKKLNISRVPGEACFGIRFEADANVLKPLFDKFYDFKLTYKHNGFEFRSFCCNQQGYITNEHHKDYEIINVNGHSYLNENMKSNRSNFSIQCKIPVGIVTGRPQEYVRHLAKLCNTTNVRFLSSRVQKVSDFMNFRPTYEFTSTYHSQSVSGIDLGQMDYSISNGFRAFIRELGKIVDVSSGDPLIYFPEMKYYANKYQVEEDTFGLNNANKCNIHLVGHSTGFLDSFISCAISGMKAAQCYI